MKARDPRIEAHSVHKLPSRAVAVILDYIPLLFIYGVAWDWIPDASSEYLEGLLVVIFGGITGRLSHDIRGSFRVDAG